MPFASYFVCASQDQMPDAFGALNALMPIESLVLPHHRWAVSGKYAQIACTIVRQCAHALTLLWICARKREPILLVCADNHYSALLTAKLLRPMRKKTKVFLFNFYLHELGQKALVKAILRTLLSSDVALFIQSEDEVRYFRNLRQEVNVEFAPFVLPDEGSFAIPRISPDRMNLGDYVFTGGRSHRDYETVIKAAAILPTIPFVIVGSRWSPIKDELPCNVRLMEDISEAAFHELLAGSRCVVVSLKANGGAAGQMVALAAMRYGKLVLYSDLPAVSQYFEDAETGVKFKAGDANDLAAKIAAYYPDAAACERVGFAGKRHTAAKHSRDEYIGKMVSQLKSWVPGSFRSLGDEARHGCLNDQPGLEAR